MYTVRVRVVVERVDGVVDEIEVARDAMRRKPEVE